MMMLDTGLHKCPLCGADLFLFRNALCCFECNTEFDEFGTVVGDIE